MVDYYVGGGSAWSSGDDPTVWFNLDIDGHDSSLHASYNTGDIDAADPFILMSNTGTLVAPAPVLFIGLSGSYHIKIDEAGISGFDGTDWTGLMGGGGGMEIHNNDYHDPDYEVANANIQSHVGTPPADSHHAATVASDLNHQDLANRSADDHHIVTDINDSPTDAETTTGISSNWAYDHTQNPTNLKHLTDDQQSALHATYTDTDVEGVITAEIAPGESIDNAIDSLILTHKNGASEHHTATIASDLNHQDLANRGVADHHAVYTNANAITAVQGEATLDLNGVLGIAGTTKTAGKLYAGTNDPTNTNRLNYDGHFYAKKVYGAVWG